MLIKFNRLYSYQDDNDPFESVQLHGFSDASMGAYGCCAYLRFTYKSGKIKVVLICSKSRVKPLKQVTIPRLELLGTLLLARLILTLKEQLEIVYDISSYHLWTDSTVAYCWIRKEHKEYKTFVQNRIQEIRKSSDFGVWNLVATKENPADIISKGCSPSELISSSL